MQNYFSPSFFDPGCSLSPPMVAKTPMKPKLAKSHENKIVRQRNVPNFAKNCNWQRKSGSDASTDVIMPLSTGEPISEKVAVTRSL